MGDGAPENRTNRLRQRLAGVVSDALSGGRWVYPRGKQRFVGVDVSDPGDDMLIQQHWLDGPVCAEQPFLKS